MPRTLVHDADDGQTLYQRVADHVAELIESGTLRPGERVPSVRRLRQQLSVSISTVLEAYRLLEDRGLIHARPQSGYYVRQPRRIEPAATLSEPGPSDTAERAQPVRVTSLAAALTQKLSDGHIIKLGAAVPDPQLLPQSALNRLFTRVLRESSDAAHAYAMPPGLLSLRRQVAKRLIDAGCTLSPDDVLITNGATEAVQLALRSVTKPGDVVAVESPTYFGFLEILESLRLKAWEISTCPREGFDLDELELAMAEGLVKAVLLSTNFTNPLGALMPEAKKHRLATMATQHRVPVIEDDIYAELGFADNRPPSLRAFDRAGWVMTIGSLSKTVSPGLRVGWCCPGRFGETMTRLKLTTSQATASIPQLVAAAYLEAGGYDHHLRRLHRCYVDQLGSLRQAIARHFPPATRLTRPVGGHVLWAEMPVSIDAVELAERAVQQNISVAPGPLFSSSGRYRNCLRLNAGLAWSPPVEQAVQTLGELARVQLEASAGGATAHPRRAAPRR